MDTLTVGQLRVNNLQIIDVTAHPEEMPSEVSAGRDYELRVCVRNTNPNDTVWYDNVQVRVAPVNPAVWFYADGSYSKQVWQSNSRLFTLHSNQSFWFTIPFRWNGNTSWGVGGLEFDTGVYGHEMPIVSGWKKLVAPI